MLELNISELRKALCEKRFGRNWTEKIASKIGKHKSTVSRTVRGKTKERKTAVAIYEVLVPEELREKNPFNELFPEFSE